MTPTWPQRKTTAPEPNPTEPPPPNPLPSAEPPPTDPEAAEAAPTAPEAVRPGAPEAEAAGAGAGAVEPEPAGSGAVEAERAGSGVAGSEPAGSGAVQAEPAGSGAAGAAPTEPEAVRPGAPEAEAAEPGSPAAGAVEPGAPEGEPSGSRPPAGRLRKAALAGTAAVLVLGGCGFLYGAHELRSQAPARNHALTDTEATTRVAGDVGNALARIFSYTPDGTAAAERSARTVLDGRAARQYETLFARVRDDLADQRVTLSTRAVRTGVVELDGDRARLLVFLDQTSHRAPGKGKGKGGAEDEDEARDAAETTTAAAQLTVTARLDDDRWRIVDIKAR
ncbi:hypothetical protein [Streptomyces ardesiacus]|uniref:hypothetical protein n=1 Tax=Streptomyces ardesiacus TaxID=285564 RepID=UPI003F4B1DDC